MAERDGFARHRLKIPASLESLASLVPGDVVHLDGIVYTAREGIYRMTLDEGVELPPHLSAISNANFHCSPAAARLPDGGFKVGGVTATASFRFSRWMPSWFERSKAQVIIGKGGMSQEDYLGCFVPAKAVYLTTVGYGTGALLGRGIRRVREVHWLEELGIAQALWVFEVENFGPFLVDGDLSGNSLFEEQGRKVNENLERIYAGLRPPALRRYGESDDRKEELI